MMSGTAGDRVQPTYHGVPLGQLPEVAGEGLPMNLESVYAPGAAGDRMRSGAERAGKKSVMAEIKHVPFSQGRVSVGGD